MSVRIAAGQHEDQPANGLKIRLLTPYLPDQQWALLIRDLVVLALGLQPCYLAKILLMNPREALTIVAPNHQYVGSRHGVRAQHRREDAGWISHSGTSNPAARAHFMMANSF